MNGELPCAHAPTTIPPDANARAEGDEPVFGAARLFALGAWWMRTVCRGCGRLWWKIESQRTTLCGRCAVHEEPLGARRQERINEAVELQELQYHGRREDDEIDAVKWDDEDAEEWEWLEE